MRSRVIASLGLSIVLLTGSAGVASPAQAASGAKESTTTAAVDYWTWRNFNSGKCLGVTGGNMTNGTKIVQWTCNGNADQSWQVIPFDNDFHGMVNKANPNKCIGVPGGSHLKGVQLVIWTCNGNNDQLWKPLFDPYFGCFVLQNKGTPSLYIGVAGASLNNGAAVVQWPYERHPDQNWC